MTPTGQDQLIKNILNSININEGDLKYSIGDQVFGFFSAIDWTQPWLMILLSFHLLCFIGSILLRHNHTMISVYFFVLLGFAALTQPLNNLGAQYWALFSTESYFDKSGLFIVVTYSFPIIFNAFVTLIFIFKATISLMIATKRAQLRQKSKKSQ